MASDLLLLEGSDGLLLAGMDRLALETTITTGITMTPATVDVGLERFARSRAERGVLHIVSPLPTGKTLIKRNGVWYCKRTPSQDELDEATYFFLGGHVYDISEELYVEISENVGPECMPTFSGVSTGLYPSGFTYPSSTTFPGGS